MEKKKKHSLLFICLGNICRSPAAEGVASFCAQSNIDNCNKYLENDTNPLVASFEEKVNALDIDEAKKKVEKWSKTPKYKTRAYTRCRLCGRPHSVLKKFGICRICFRELAYKGEIPGCKKASW